MNIKRIWIAIRKLFYSTIDEEYHRGVDYVNCEIQMFGRCDKVVDRLYAEIDHNTETRTAFDRGMSDALHSITTRSYPASYGD